MTYQSISIVRINNNDSYEVIMTLQETISNDMISGLIMGFHIGDMENIIIQLVDF